MSRLDRSSFMDRSARPRPRRPSPASISIHSHFHSDESEDSDGPSHSLDLVSNLPANPFEEKYSSAAYDWNLMKRHGETSKSLDELMQYQGLEEVKQLFLDIKHKVDVCKKQGGRRNKNILKLERFSIIFQGNPGTGKTTVARLYAKFLHEEGILGSDNFKETSGIKAALEGAKGMESIVKDLTKNGGGVLFVDEAYQLMAPYTDNQGKQALDMILTELENNIGKLAAIFVGYKDQMEPFFEHNPGLESRIPHVVNFDDFDESQLWRILAANIHKHYRGQMRVERGMDGLYMRVAIRRLAQARGSRSFGNARAVENLLARIRKRQAHRLAQKKKEMWEKRNCRHEELDYFFFTKEDIIGPNPSIMAKRCPAWMELNNLVGLEEVKNSAKQLIDMVEFNYERELDEKPPLKFSLNQIFVGNPGTGKTTVAKLYGEIFSYLGYLSHGDIVLKTPPDFIGSCLGESETKTRNILQSTVGKVLVIDEAYMLDAGDSEREQDKFKSGVIDTIVSMVQGVPGEDRCIILIGYENEIRNMFQNANPGLSRRFPIEHPFHFTNFIVDQLEQILHVKMAEDGLRASQDALLIARQLFTRALMRPNFTNAGEVNNILAAAKMSYEARISRLPLRERFSAVKLEAIDFDPDVGRTESFELNYEKLVTMLDRRIVDRLASYQRSYRDVVKLHLDPRRFVPTNFIFKGPSGT
ncbi:hypothetical protein TGAMA5MH_04460 [Trichoderma gamsii]|uniref:AAA+ ATPase domain-containing protein n=1 Tax=Trichoderma gamsii TaxID=398673 RepID=A0A2K0TD90_9HYPO|nr:hypothetical protein TGAMA5MH_04460 [Trichoderma gamsii]